MSTVGLSLSISTATRSSRVYRAHMGWIKDRGRRIEAQHWRGVLGYLAPAEQPIDYIRVWDPETQVRGWLHLTHQRLLWTSVWGGQHKVEGEMPLTELSQFAIIAGAPKSMVAVTDRPRMRFDVPGDVPKAFVRLFVAEVRKAAGLR